MGTTQSEELKPSGATSKSKKSKKVIAVLISCTLSGRNRDTEVPLSPELHRTDSPLINSFHIQGATHYSCIHSLCSFITRLITTNYLLHYGTGCLGNVSLRDSVQCLQDYHSNYAVVCVHSFWLIIVGHIERSENICVQVEICLLH